MYVHKVIPLIDELINKLENDRIALRTQRDDARARYKDAYAQNDKPLTNVVLWELEQIEYKLCVIDNILDVRA